VVCCDVNAVRALRTSADSLRELISDEWVGGVICCGVTLLKLGHLRCCQRATVGGSNVATLSRNYGCGFNC
jgi:hypothetical protein